MQGRFYLTEAMCHFEIVVNILNVIEKHFYRLIYFVIVQFEPKVYCQCRTCFAILIFMVVLLPVFHMSSTYNFCDMEFKLLTTYLVLCSLVLCLVMSHCYDVLGHYLGPNSLFIFTLLIFHTAHPLI